ncbi:MAG: DUF364 domain-containing protein [Gracilibacteraceae bacterium]|jgi:uncharacterized protein (DUF4213/DUF364 family)|nr:DUF364 domain-containing protein [Gracilibacteraceae bacterium]
MWALYDDLIQGVPDNLTADFIVSGAKDSLVRCGTGYGFTHTLEWGWRPDLLSRRAPGMKLRDLAECIKSWNFVEASLGLAALNAYYNEIERVRALGVHISESRHVEDRAQDPFIARQSDIKDKNVTVIGHFPYIDQLFAPICRLSVIEKFNPQDGDYPEQAADFLLPASDFVFISSYTLVEKTLPRYLALARNACVTIVGPSTPMAPILFRYGAAELAGYVVKDGPALESAALGHGGSHHGVGQKVSLKAPEQNLRCAPGANVI